MNEFSLSPPQDKNATYQAVASNTLKTRGPIGFYRGLSSMVYFAAPKAAIRFGAFEFCSGLLSTADGGDKFGLGPVSVSVFSLFTKQEGGWGGGWRGGQV